MKKLRVLILLFLITIIISSCNQTTQHGRYQMFKSRQMIETETKTGPLDLFGQPLRGVTYQADDNEYVYVFDTQTGNITVLLRRANTGWITKRHDYKHE